MINYNKKLIFQKFFLDNTYFFLICIASLSLIVWIIQAVNFLDFVTEDGHGLIVYFKYTLLNIPKIISRLMPFILGVLILLLDQWTKYLVKTNLFYGESISIIDGFFNLVFIKNDGAAWNIMSGQRLILVLISS